MEYGFHEYRCRIVDANVIRVLPREVAQAVMVPTTLVLRSLVRDIGKELPRVEPVVCMLFGASKLKARLETFPACMFRGYLKGKPFYRRVLHTRSYFFSKSFVH